MLFEQNTHVCSYRKHECIPSQVYTVFDALHHCMLMSAINLNMCATGIPGEKSTKGFESFEIDRINSQAGGRKPQKAWSKYANADPAGSIVEKDS